MITIADVDNRKFLPPDAESGNSSTLQFSGAVNAILPSVYSPALKSEVEMTLLEESRDVGFVTAALLRAV
jgi:hypothetical protein